MESTPDAPPKDHRRHLLVFHRGSSWMHEPPDDGSILIGRGDTLTISDLGSHNGSTGIPANRRRAPGDG